MIKILRVTITLLIIILTLLSLFYGLRFFNLPFLYESNNGSFVVTLPNRVWFELNQSDDTIVPANTAEKLQPFNSETSEFTKHGLNLGLNYPKLTSTVENVTVKKVQSISRVANRLTIDTQITGLNKYESSSYIQKFFFSQFGDFDDKNNIYIQEGCSVKISSANGNIRYVKEYSIVEIKYSIKESIRDQINLDIKCVENK